MWRSNALYFIEKLTLKHRRAHWEALSYRLCSLAGGMMLSQLPSALLGLYLYTIFQTIFLLLLWLPATNHSLLPQSQLYTALSLPLCPFPDLFCFLFRGLTPSFLLHFPVSSVSIRTTSDPAHTMIFFTSSWSPKTPVLAPAIIPDQVSTMHCPSFSCGLSNTWSF